MSSPSAFAGHTSPPPVAASGELEDDDDKTDDLPRRQMGVKVIYTFDDQNKTNCLVRVPGTFNIPTIFVDESAEVGIIELKACIQAIVQASPELVAKLAHDYTVYAYDYSEYETPLVGQGLLSWVLASASSTPAAPADQSKTMITGRVMKNLFGRFSNASKETLEVKLKLVPVPTSLQSEYIENMERYRHLSQVMPEGFDHSSWATLLRTNPALSAIAGHQTGLSMNEFRDDSPGFDPRPILGEPVETGNLSRRGSEGYGLGSGPYSANPSRAGSPTPSMRSSAALQFITHDPSSRPASRASNKSQNLTRSRHASFDAGSFSEPNGDEGGPRKRARITKTDLRGKAAFGTNPQSLRVTASTAASVRVLGSTTSQPINTNSVEPPPRAPTPRPGEMNLPQNRRIGQPYRRTNLRDFSMRSSPVRYISPYSDAPLTSDPVFAPNDDDQGISAGETPMEFPSSPPVLPLDNESPAPSSPGLPTLPYLGDSGFVSDSIVGQEEEVEPSKEKAEVPVIDHRKRSRAPPDRSDYPWLEVQPGPRELLPTKMPPRPIQPKRVQASGSKRNKRIAPESEGGDAHSQQQGQFPPTPPPSFLRTDSEDAVSIISATDPQGRLPSAHAILTASSLALPPLPPSNLDASLPLVNSEDPLLKGMKARAPRKRPSGMRGRKMPRAQTWSGDQVLTSDAATGDDMIGQQAPRSGSGAIRKKVIKDRLEEFLAAGEMPPYCQNCGQIQTPTWRKAFTRIHTGSIDGIEVSTKGNGIVGYEAVQDDISGVPQYRLFKKSLNPAEANTGIYERLTLCNPCGLWFDKKGTMRPPYQWDKTAQSKKPRKAYTKKKTGTQAEQTETQAENTPDPPEPIVIADEVVTEDSDTPTTTKSTSEAPVSDRPRACSVSGGNNNNNNNHNNGMTDEESAAALRRAIQSSPARFLGTHNSPIEIDADLTPKPTRRLLFPSPRKEAELKCLQEKLKASLTKGGSSESSQEEDKSDKATEASDGTGTNTPTPEADDKENMPPLANEPDDLAYLFEDQDMNPLSATPKSTRSREDLTKTPTSKSRSGRAILTPRRFLGELQDSVNLDTPSRAPRTNSVATPVPLTPFTAHLNLLLSDGPNRSPPRPYDFSTFPSFPMFDSPNRRSGLSDGFFEFSDFDADMTYFGTDITLPSSPPPASTSLAFALYEDPATATPAIWATSSVFDGSDALTGLEVDEQPTKEGVTEKEASAVDFAAILDEVVGSHVGEEQPQAAA